MVFKKNNKYSFRKGDVPWNKGKPMSEKTKKKMGKKVSIALKGKTPKNFNSIKGMNKGKKFPEFSGEKHYNWKGGITPLNQKLRESSKYQIWRNAVFLRDNFTCQNPNCEFCNNKIGVFLHAHHIKSWKDYSDLRFHINNGITYCAEYHLKSGLHKNKIVEMEVETSA